MIENVDLATRAFCMIRDEITAGVHPAGTPLQLPHLSRRLGVSQTPIREALLRLAEKQYLEKNSARSYVVKQVSKRQFFKLSEIRAEIEAKTVAEMIEDGLDFALDAMAGIYDEQAQALAEGAYGRALILNRDFHGHYLRRSDTPQVAEFVEDICVIAGPILQGLKHNRLSQDKDKHFHRYLLDAIARHDVQAAVSVVRDDVMRNATRICSLMC